MKKKKKKKKNKYEEWAGNNQHFSALINRIVTVLLLFFNSLISYSNYSLCSQLTVKDILNQKETIGQVKGELIGNSTECDSNFLDNKWAEDERWLKNEQEFIFIPDETKKGGPKMDFKNLANDNFKLTFKFEPVTNENNKNNEINLVIYIGDLYEIVLGDGNRKNFYLKSDGKYISEIKTKLNIIPFEHPIMFDEWTTIEIDQNVSSNSKTRSIKVSFDYCPFIFGKYGCNKNQPEIYLFEIDDSSDPEKVLRLISIGLRNSSSVIKTKLYYFELENR